MSRVGFYVPRSLALMCDCFHKKCIESVIDERKILKVMLSTVVTVGITRR